MPATRLHIKLINATSIILYTLFYKNIVFPTKAECSYFSAEFRLNIFL